MSEINQEFAKCWQRAGLHLSKLLEPHQTEMAWLKASLESPFLEHLSFRLGNQLFFIRLQAAGDVIKAPGNIQGLLSIADGCKGHPCLMPMAKQFANGAWQPQQPAWGLLDARNGAAVNPPDLLTDEKIEMTAWELHDFAVQVVRQQLEKNGRKIMSSQGNPEVDPSVWFVGDKGPEWVVVRATRYPLKHAQRPTNWPDIAANCSRLSSKGHFASVSFASSCENHASTERTSCPLYRGAGMIVNYEGLED